MKKVFFLVIVLFCINFMVAQKNSYVVSYESAKDIGDKLAQVPPAFREQVKAQLAAPNFFELVITNNQALYKKSDKKSAEPDPLTASNNVKIITTGSNADGSSRFTDLNKSQYTKQAVVLDKPFLVSGNLQKINWKLTDETKKLGNYNLQKAVLDEGSNYVEAWYAPELPFPFGPDKYWGLPGLIVELKTPVFYYVATDIQKTSLQEITPPAKGKKVSEEELQNILKESTEALRSGAR